jgi:outer membrane protein assembly factor BamB
MDGQKASLFVENGVVFVYVDRLYAYQASNGALLWQSQGASQPLSGSNTTDLLVNPGPKGTVYTDTFGGLTAYSTDNGSRLWHDASLGQVLEMTLANGVIYAAQQFGASALDAHTGKLLWSYKANLQDWGYSGFLGPLTDRNTLYINNFMSGLAALDIHTGNLRWQAQAGGNGIRPTLVDGTLFIGDGEGVITALRARDGKTLWRFPTNGGMSFPSALTVV